MRKTLVTFFLFMNVISLPFSLFSKTLTVPRVTAGILTLPFVFLGAYLGNKVVEKIPQRAFRLLALGTVCITGLISIYSGFY